MEIKLSHVTKRFETFTALDDITLTIGSAELVAFLGPSGSGKTTLLRLIAGLEVADAGQIYFGEEDATFIAVQERGVGFVFQHYALFRHMTVFDNIAFGLRTRRGKEVEKGSIHERVKSLLSMMQLKDMEKRFPAQLSGGQRQRVALARALAIEPKVLLLDEPFGALDAQVRKELRRRLRRLHNKTGYTTLFVTHDQDEALELADRVVVMHEGRIVQTGSPYEVYHHPNSPFVYDFIGNTNRFEVDIRDNNLAYLQAYERPFLALKGDVQKGKALVFVRPHNWQVERAGELGLEGEVVFVHYQNGMAYLEVACRELDSVIDVSLIESHPVLKDIDTHKRLLLIPDQFGLFPQ